MYFVLTKTSEEAYLEVMFYVPVFVPHICWSCGAWLLT